MKLNHVLLASFIASTASLLFASSDTDGKIKDAAKASYNYRTLLADKVTVHVDEGVVTLTGSVTDKDLISLAEDTVSNLPGVVRVDNKIAFDSSLEEHSDAWIAWKIRYELLVRANVSNSDTKVDVKDGVVTLTGTADNLAQKELTGLYAKEMNGVKDVKNEITLSPAPSSAKTASDTMDDASITSQVKYALLTHKSTSAIKTKVVTNDGVVVITGVAASPAEVSLVTKLAESIRGVKTVTNNMTVKN